MIANKKLIFTLFMFLAILVAQFASPSAVYAAGVVGTGTPGSCTESALNTALSGGGAVSFNCGASPVTITITTTKTISSATQIDGGGLITISGGNSVRLFTVNSSVAFSITNLSLINGFVSNGNGGAININSGATVTISNSTFDNNNTLGTVLNGAGYGGAIYVNGATLNITNSTFNDNGANVTSIGDLALGGGAIQNNDGTVTISGSAFSNNFVDSYTADGGAIYNGDLDADAVDTLTITNSTFYSNQLAGDTGGSSGGAIRSNSVMTLTHNTFSANDGGMDEVGGESGAVTVAGGSAKLINNIFANSSAIDCAMRTGTTLDGTSGGNLIEQNHIAPNNCGTPLSVLDPNLGAFQNNGGLTSTLAVISPSDAINAVVCATGVTTDQRGVSRPQESNCEIGSFETGDSIGPVVTNVTSTTANGAYGTGNIIPVTVTFNEIVIVTGTPQLTLETGATDRTVNYSSGSGTSTLTFNYTVQSGDVSGDLDYVGTGSLTLNGGTIRDGANNNATLTLASPGAAGSLSANKAIVIDTIVPTVTNVTSTTANGTYGVSSVIAVTVTFSESVTVTGTPQLTLETGATDRTANYSSGTGTSTLTFNYTVQNGDNSGDLDYVGTGSLTLNGGTIRDGANNNATLTLASPGAAGSLGANKAIVIEGIVPTVTNVTSTTADGTYNVGGAIAVTVTFSESVTVTGTPQLTLETGATDRTVNYASGSGTSTLTFNYTVQSGDVSGDLDYVGTGSLTLNGGTIRDGANNNATLTLASPGAAGSLGANKAIVIDGVVPTVTNVTSTTANGAYTTGSAIAVTVTFNESVTVTGTPQLTLETGATDRTVNYASGSGTSTLTFNYTVQAGDTSGDLDYVGTGSLTLNGGTIRDGANNNATLTLASPGAAGSLGVNKAIVIDTTAPTVSITSTAPASTNTSPIPVTITFSESVTGFVVGEITVGNGSAGSFSGSGTTYTANITPSGEGTVTVDVAAGVAVDVASNSNTAATQLSRTYDITAPTVNITGKPTDPTASTSADFVFTTAGSPTLVECKLDSGSFAACDTGTTQSYAGPLALGSHTFTIRVTDDATNTSTAPYTWNIVDFPPVVNSVIRVDANPTNAASVNFTVTFSEDVTGVNTSSPFDDFTLTTTGVTGASITAVTPVSAFAYTVTVGTGSGNGTIRLDVVDDDTIEDATNNKLGGTGAGNGNFATGEVYTVNKTVTKTFRSAGAQDGWTLESSETSGLGGTMDSTATVLNLGDDAAKKQYRSILSFNTASLPDNAVITKVTLKLKKQGVVGGGDPVSMFQGFMADVKKGSFGTSALAIGDFQAVGKKTIGPASPTLTSGWYSLNLTPAKNIINKLTTGGGLTQIRIRFNLDDNNNAIANYLRIYSGNAGAASRPQLIVEYNLP